MVIAAANPSTEEYEKSYLIKPYSSGVTTIQVVNTDRFSANTRVLIGVMGYEASEIVTVSAVSSDGKTLTLDPSTPTKFSHSIDDPVIILRFDQVKFYISTTGKTGEYNLLAGTPVNLDVDNDTLQTYFDDITGVAGNYYKSALYHSISTLEGVASDPVGGSGYTRAEVGRFIDEFLREIKDPDGTTIDRDTLFDWLNDCSDDLTTRTKRPYDFLSTRAVLATVAGNQTVSIPTDVWKFDNFEYFYTPEGGTLINYPVRRIGYEEFRMKTQDSTELESDALELITIDKAVDKFRLYPTPETSQSGVIYMYYWKYFTEINSEGDEFETPTRLVYKFYCLERYYRAKSRVDSSQTTLADRYNQKYEVEVSKLPRTKQLDSGSPKGFKFQPQNYKGNRKY